MVTSPTRVSLVNLNKLKINTRVPSPTRVSLVNLNKLQINTRVPSPTRVSLVNLNKLKINTRVTSPTRFSLVKLNKLKINTRFTSPTRINFRSAQSHFIDSTHRLFSRPGSVYRVSLMTYRPARVWTHSSCRNGLGSTCCEWFIANNHTNIFYWTKKACLNCECSTV